MRFGVLLADPAWSFSDRLSMSKVRRGASSHYGTMSIEELCSLPVADILADDAVGAVWCPKSMLPDGLRVLDAWGLSYRTLYSWVKQRPSGVLGFGMGRLFRSCEEVALVGIRGKVYPALATHSERDVLMAPPMPHSRKPDGLHEALSRMYPTWPKIELFARRTRDSWTTCGAECPDTPGEDIRSSLARLAREEAA